jgi:predicted AlkP superfamily phosphohydrolase/phosphomutase
VYVDPAQALAKLVVGDEEIVLTEGEWSEWTPVDFDLIPTQGLRGMARFYLKQVRPDFALYVSPINIDPMEPALPVSGPDDYASELARATGRFYTQGMPEDTKALSAGVLTRDEFLAQARIAGNEVARQYWHVLAGFDEGLLFYYFGNLDQVSHMMWRPMDPGHPAYDPQTDPRYAHVIENLYAELDAIVGETMKRAGPETLVVVMSDHGFASWRRSFHLNTWLEQNGYLTLRNPNNRRGELYSNVDWSKTRAYGLGLNGLYINVRGREQHGTVAPEQREGLAREIAAKLLQTIDPATGQRAVTKVYAREETYAHLDVPEITPDLLVGYAKGTRGSNESALGEVPADVIVDNRDLWSGDHCMDHETVPGVLFTSRPLRTAAPSLQSLAAALLAEFDVREF